MPVKNRSRRPHGTGSVRPMGRQWEGRFHHKGKPLPISLGLRKEVDPEVGITETEALENLQKYIATYEASVPNGRTTLRAFCPKFVAHKKSKNRSKSTMTAIDVAIRCHLVPEFGDRYMDDITADDFELWMVKELKMASPKSVGNWRSVGNSIWDFGVKKRVVKENVVAQTEAPYVPKKLDVDFMTMADVAAVREAFPDTPMGRLMSLVVLVAARCGLRESEIIALRWKDIRWDTGWIRVAVGHVRGETKLPKGKKGRSTPLPEIVKVAFLAWFKITSRNGPDDLVFGHPLDGSEQNASALNERFKDAVVESGIRPTELRRYKKRNGDYEMRDYVALTFHDLRHAWCSWCVAHGHPIAIVQKWGGWDDAETMALYEHFSPSGFEVDQMNTAIEREMMGEAAKADGPIGPRDWLSILGELRKRCEEESLEYPFDAEEEKLILVGAPG